MAEDPLAEELQKAFQEGAQRKNYVADIAGNLGVKVRAPSLTNLPNTLIVSSHGERLSGFGPDKTATNSLAKVVREKLDSGDQLSLEDIASRMGSATNDVKRAIIDACYAAGYNFNKVKSLFPNIEEIIAPSTGSSTSAQYLRYLTRPSPEPSPYSLKDLSPFFRVTPTSTNVIRQASDWLPKPEIKKVVIPLTQREKELDAILPKGKDVWTEDDYAGKQAIPSKEIKRQSDAILEWHRQRLKQSKTQQEIDEIDAETHRRLNELFE